MTLAAGHIIRAGLGKSLLPGPHRVLVVSSPRNAVWLIGLTTNAPSGPSRKNHMLGPCRYDLAEIADAIECGQLVTEDVPLPGSWQMTDADYLRQAPNPGELKRREARLKIRDARWRVVQFVVGNQLAREFVPVAGGLRKRILEASEVHDISVPTVYSWLHRFLAGRECLNSLLPNTNRCGNPGQRKVPSGRRLGRKSRLAKVGLIPNEGYILTKEDRNRLALGYALVKAGTTVCEAYRLTMGAFWATSTQDEQGKLKHELWPQHDRPTQPQFEYWGRELYGTPFRRKMMGSDRWATSTLAVAGSAQDQVHAVGQMAMIDSTSTDVYLTSVMSRLNVLPPMHRTIVVDVRSTFVTGFYCGWEDPSSETSLQAILCAATDKRELAAQFGIDLDEDEWPGMLHRLYLADNGEMKSEAIKEAEKQFGFGVEYVKSYSGQSKSLVENKHHTDHKALDHKLPGTTLGRQRERGERAPATQALWNYYEYMYELILTIIAYNNEEVPDLAPTDMRIAGVRPTRVNIFRWLRVHNMRADIPCDLNLLRAFTLPGHAAILRREGIYLLMADGIRHLPGHRFFTPELVRDDRWKTAARHTRSVNVVVKLDAQELHHVWLPTSHGLLKVPNVMAEQIQLSGLTLADWLEFQHQEDLHRDQSRQLSDQQGLDTLVRQGETTHEARLEQEREKSQLAQKPNKKSRPTQLRKNKEDEKNYLNGSVAREVSAAEVINNIGSRSRTDSVAAAAMQAFHARERS